MFSHYQLTLAQIAHNGQVTPFDSANSQHHVDNAVQHNVDLRLSVAAPLRPENGGSHIVDGDRPTVFKVLHEFFCKAVDIRTAVALGEKAGAGESVTIRPAKPVDKYLGNTARFVRPRLLPHGMRSAFSFSRSESVFKPFERGIYMSGRIATFLHGESSVTDVFRRQDVSFVIRVICASRRRQELLNLLNAIAMGLLTRSRKGSTHCIILP